MSRRQVREAQEAGRELDSLDDETKRPLPETITADRFFNGSPPEQDWLLEGLLEQGRTALFVAPGGTGKSMFALQLCASVVADLPVCEGLFEIGEDGAGAALYLSAEETEDDIHRRFHWIIRNMSDESRDTDHGNVVSLKRRKLQEKCSQFHVMSLVGYPTHFFGELGDKTWFFQQSLQEANSIANLKLIVIDPLRRFFPGSEVDSADVTQIVNLLERLAQETGATVIALHHMSQDAARSRGTDQYAARGSTALTDAFRFQMNMKVIDEKIAERNGILEEDRRWYITVTVTKNNYAPPQTRNRYLKREEGGYLRVVELDQQGEDTNLLTSVVQKVEEDYEGGQRMGKADFIKEYAGKDGLFGVGQKRLSAIIEEAVSNELLQYAKDTSTGRTGRRAHILVPVSTSRTRNGERRIRQRSRS